MGKEGVGKTHAWMDLANYVEGNFWIIDTDDSVDAMMEDDALSAIEPKIQDKVVPLEWPDFRDTVTKWKKNVDKDDWAVVDMNNESWNTVQAYYTEQVFGQDEDEYLLMKRKEIEQKEDSKGGLYSEVFEGWMDWPVINKMYRKYAMTLLRLPCHLFIITPADKVDKNKDAKEVLEQYGQAGVKPVGQKHQGHMASSIMYFHGRAPDNLHVTTVKDRGKREYVKGKELDRGFAKDYLLDIAGWQVKKKKKGGGSSES